MQPVLLALVLAAVLPHVPLVSPAALREKAAAERRGSGRGKRAESYVATRRFPLKLTRRRSVHRDDMGKVIREFIKKICLTQSMTAGDRFELSYESI